MYRKYISLLLYCQGKYVETSMPTKQDLEMICRGEMALVWDWITTNVKPKSTVRKMKGTIEAYSGNQFKKEDIKLSDLKVLICAFIYLEKES